MTPDSVKVNGVKQSNVKTPSSMVYRQLLIDCDAVLDAVERRFGIVVDKIVRLHGFSGPATSYHIVKAGAVRKEFIFKVFSNPQLPSRHVEAEISLVQYLAGKGLPVPRIVASKDNKFSSSVDFFHGNPMLTRMQTYLRGDLLNDVDLTPKICSKLGCLAGTIDVILSAFENEFYRENVESLSIVNVNNDRRVTQMVSFLENEEIVAVANEALNLFESQVQPNLANLPNQQIHGSIDGVSTVVNFNRPDKDGLPWLALFDFGHSRVTYRVYECVVSMASILSIGGCNLDAFECAKAFLGEYRRIIDLNGQEVKLIEPLVITRLAVLMVTDQYRVERGGDSLHRPGRAKVAPSLLKGLIDDNRNGKSFLI